MNLRISLYKHVESTLTANFNMWSEPNDWGHINRNNNGAVMVVVLHMYVIHNLVVLFSVSCKIQEQFNDTVDVTPSHQPDRLLIDPNNKRRPRPSAEFYL